MFEWVWENGQSSQSMKLQHQGREDKCIRRVPQLLRPLEHLLAKVWYSAFHVHNTTNSQWRHHSTTQWSQKGPHEESRTTTWTSMDLIRVNVVVIVLELIVRDESGWTYLSCRSLTPDWAPASLLEWFWATTPKIHYTKISLITAKFLLLGRFYDWRFYILDILVSILKSCLQVH